MAIAMWQSGRRLFSAAGILMILTSVAHTAGNLAGAPDPAQQKLLTDMNGVHIPLGMGMNPSMQDIYWDLLFTMSITFAALGLVNVVLAASSGTPVSVLRRVSWVNAVWVGAFLILNWVYRIPPALISGAIVEVVVLAALVSSRRRTGEA